jgi:hypothetical protein
MFTEHQGLCEVDHGMREGNPGIEVGRGVIELVKRMFGARKDHPDDDPTRLKTLFESGPGLYLVLSRHSTGTGDLLGQLQHVIGSRSARE